MTDYMGLDPRPWFFSIIGRLEGTPADDYKAVLHALADRGARINARPHDPPQPDWPLGGISLNVADHGRGDPRGRVAFPTREADPNGWFTHEIDIIVDSPRGPGLFDWGWNDHLGGPPIVLTATATTAPPLPPPEKPPAARPPDPTILAVLESIEAKLRTLIATTAAGDDAIIGKLDELKVSVNKAATEIRNALPNIGGLFGRRSPADGE